MARVSGKTKAQPTYLVLELGWIPGMDRHYTAIHMQLSYDGAASFQLWPVGVLATLAQPQQTNQDILLRVLVGQEGLPPTISCVVSSYQLCLRCESSICGIILDLNMLSNTRLQMHNISYQN